jgi:hypothetical protein
VACGVWGCSPREAAERDSSASQGRQQEVPLSEHSEVQRCGAAVQNRRPGPTWLKAMSAHTLGPSQDSNLSNLFPPRPATAQLPPTCYCRECCEHEWHPTNRSCDCAGNMRNNGESDCRWAKKSKQIGKSRNHEATSGIIRVREQDPRHRISRAIAATPEARHIVWQEPSKDNGPGSPAHTTQQINLRQNTALAGR